VALLPERAASTPVVATAIPSPRTVLRSWNHRGGRSGCEGRAARRGPTFPANRRANVAWQEACEGPGVDVTVVSTSRGIWLRNDRR
jgi:hypothetical protein